MIKSMNSAWWIKRWSELHPQKAAIIFEGAHISYFELYQKLNQTCCWLQSLGIKKGDRIAVMLGNCPEFLELFLACSKMGAIFVPINYRLASAELEYTLTNARPRLFVFGEEFAETVALLALDHSRTPMLMAGVGEPEITTADAILDYRAETTACHGETPSLNDPMAPADPEEAHVIMYTSGTTGQPKGAVLSHRKTFFNCLNADIFFKLHFDDMMLIALPLFHSGGLFIQASPVLYKGATIVLHRNFDPHKTFRDIRRYQVTKFLGVPTIYKALVKAGPENKAALSALKVCAIGGEKLTPDLMKQFKAAGFSLRQIMGQTETSILLWAHEKDVFNKPGSVGKPVFHAEVRLVDRQGQTCAPGEVGEIVVRGSVMMTEYWQDPVKTGATIRGGWLHTGDLARVDEDGYFYLIDRIRDMYISGGENVYPAEVEQVLRRHPAVEDAAVVGIPDETWGEVGCAFVIVKAGAEVRSEDLLGICKGELARYKWPRQIVLADNFPRTALGKVRKTVLKKRRRDQ